MSRVSYQLPDDAPPVPLPTFRPLDAGAIATRRRDAKVTFTVDLSQRQRRWLKRLDTSGAKVDAGTVLRALVDLGMELDVDWTAIDGPPALRAAIRESVLVRRRP